MTRLQEKIFLRDASFFAILRPTADTQQRQQQQQELFSGHSQLLHQKTLVSHRGQK